jgi:exonuclease SbcD
MNLSYFCLRKLLFLFSTPFHFHMFRILHTSDWHLGHRFQQVSVDRYDEHRQFLDWLLEQVVATQANAVVVSGDIFDVGRPPLEAQKLYYNFCAAFSKTPCRHLVITAGNHDNPTTLNVGRELLDALDIRVVTHYDPDDPRGASQYLLELLDAQSKPEAIVAAVPFLRARDLIAEGPAHETVEQSQQRLTLAIHEHYAELGRLAEGWQRRGIPTIALGHLFVSGYTASESEKEPAYGSVERFPVTLFSPSFDYVALGHIHKPQQLGGQNRIRYCGSPIMLSFSERNDQKVVLQVDLVAGQEPVVKPLPCPIARKLVRITGDQAAVEAKLDTLVTTETLPTFLEVEYILPHYIPEITESTRQRIRPNPLLTLLKCLVRITTDPLEIEASELGTNGTVSEELRMLEPEAVFREFLAVHQKPADTDPEGAALLACFREVLQQLQQTQEVSE